MHGREVDAEELVEGGLALRRAALERQPKKLGRGMSEMPFGPPVTVVPVEQDDADDLAEAERHDREIVAAQPQHRKAQQDAERGGEQAGQRQADPEAEAEVVREQRVGVGADRVERDVAEVEQAGEADHDVQAPAEHHVDQHRGRRCRPRSGWRTAGTAGRRRRRRPAATANQARCGAIAAPGSRRVTGAAPRRRRRAARRAQADQQQPARRTPAAIADQRPSSKWNCQRRCRRRTADRPHAEQRQRSRTKATKAARPAPPCSAGRPVDPAGAAPRSARRRGAGHRLRPSRSRAGRAGRSAGRSAPATRMREGRHVLVLDREIAGPERLDQADHQAAQHGARDRADAAQHRRGERLDAGEEADEEVDHAVVERGHQAGDRGQRRAHDEGQRDRAVDVDAAQRRPSSGPARRRAARGRAACGRSGSEKPTISTRVSSDDRRSACSRSGP